VLGLPGNPASALVCAELFLWPMVRRMLGLPTERPIVSARLETALAANGAREHWMRAVLSEDDAGWRVNPIGDQDSSLVGVFARAGALLRRSPGAASVAAGDSAPILRLDRAS
jgi:molybdopterin molybdotransferase